ncbi:MAG: metallophosphoesterase [bacterium]
MFGIILLSAVTLMHVYVFWRSGSVPLLMHRVPRKILMEAGIGLWALFLLGRIFGHSSTGPIARMLELFGMNWMAVVFLTTVSLLMIDIITGFGFLLRRFAPSLRGMALVAGGVLSVVALVQGLRPPVVQEYEVELSGLPQEIDGTVLVALSDLHVGAQLGRRWLEARVAQVQAQKPDIVVLLGDLFEGHGQPQEELFPVLQRLSAPLGVWAVLGNHESHGRQNAITSLLNDDGITVLNNTWVEVRPSLVLAGVVDLTANHNSGQEGDPVSKALAGRPLGATILLSHTPWEANRIASTGAGLMLSGHTHGGQIWPFGYLVQYTYPLLAGQYEVNGMTVIVCRGTGIWGPRMRLWRPAEILRVTLRAKGSESY